MLELFQSCPFVTSRWPWITPQKCTNQERRLCCRVPLCVRSLLARARSWEASFFGADTEPYADTTQKGTSPLSFPSTLCIWIFVSHSTSQNKHCKSQYATILEPTNLPKHCHRAQLMMQKMLSWPVDDANNARINRCGITRITRALYWFFFTWTDKRMLLKLATFECLSLIVHHGVTCHFGKE